MSSVHLKPRTAPTLAFTGGAGIADHWQGHAEDPDHWRDIQIVASLLEEQS